VGWDVGKDRVYREENLGLRRKRPWRHVSAVHRLERRPTARANEVWGMDFVADQLANGRKIHTLTIVDSFARECLALEPLSLQVL
jgi:putative transposase